MIRWKRCSSCTAAMVAVVLSALGGSCGASEGPKAGEKLAPWSLSLNNWKDSQVKAAAESTPGKADFAAEDAEYVSVGFVRSLFADKGTAKKEDQQTGRSEGVWYAGSVDFYGRQETVNVAVGRATSRTLDGTARMFVGWSHNELRNIVKPEATVPQANDGSAFAGEFAGPHVGIEFVHRANKRLAINTRLQALYLLARTPGEEGSPGPAWYWDGDGGAAGYQAAIGVNYQLSPAVSAEFGYRYYYAKLADGDDFVRPAGDYSGADGVDLRHSQHGLYYGIKALF